MDMEVISAWADHEAFKDVLLNGEKIIWVGQPDTSVIFTKADIYLIPFCILFNILFGIPALYMETSSLSQNGNGERMPLALLVFFVIADFHLTFGRFIYKAWKKKRTYYMVTDQRVLASSLGLERDIRVTPIRDIPTIDKSIGSKGIGSIFFGDLNIITDSYANTGLQRSELIYGRPTLAFYDIRDANRIYKLVTELRNEQLSSSGS